jgi:hypothetical protein
MSLDTRLTMSIMCDVKGSILKPYKRTEAHGMVCSPTRNRLIPVRSPRPSQDCRIGYHPKSGGCNAPDLEFEEDEIRETHGTGVFLGSIQG